LIEEIDRLPDWAYTDSELDAMAAKILKGQKYGECGHLVMYHLYKDGVNTGVVMLLSVESISDGLHALNRLWGQYGIYGEIGEFREIESVTAAYELNTLQIVLNKYKYEGKIEALGSDKLYKYKPWFNELIR
jgi:hypothetical protein